MDFDFSEVFFKSINLQQKLPTINDIFSVLLQWPFIGLFILNQPKVSIILNTHHKNNMLFYYATEADSQYESLLCPNLAKFLMCIEVHMKIC